MQTHGADSSLSRSLADAIAAHSARIGVIGLGYVGLPLVELFAGCGFAVLGLDIDATKVERLQAGESYIGHIASDRVRTLRDGGHFEATSDFSRLTEVDAILICVPTPLGKHREPDLSAVVETGRSIGRYLRPGQLVILESTTYPGTTRDVLKPELEAGGLVAGRDFFLAYSPEREDPGNPKFSAGTIPKVVGGYDETSGQLAQALYRTAVPEVVPVTSCEVAEACKILENTYRAVNIALVNELKLVFERMGIDVWEVIDAAKTKPFGFQAFYPGPGLGGHCLSGREQARVRHAERGLDTILPLAELFSLFQNEQDSLQLGDVKVVEPLGLETLSVNLETGGTGWQAVAYLFQRRFQGRMVETRLAGGLVLRTTSRHPMLILEEDQLIIREAGQLRPGDLLPRLEAFEVASSGTTHGAPADPREAMAATPGVPTRWTRDRCLAVVGVDFDQADELVYSVEVPGTQTFATSGGVFVHNCIPIDPFYLTWAAQSYGVHTRFIELAGEINTSMPLYVLDRVMTALNERSKPLKGSRVLVLGAAYKPNVDDCRESPAIELMELLQERGVIVSYSDPYVPALPAMRGRTIRLESVPITPEMLAAQDCVLIATDHSAFDWNLILAHAGLVVDTRGATRSALGESGNASVIRA